MPWTDRDAARLRKAYDRCARDHDYAGGGFMAFAWTSATEAEQTHHGTTEYALAAWVEWRRAHPDRIRRARGVVNYRVPDLHGARRIETTALILETAGGDSLALTGCSWGYGGEGPHGTALVLCDAGFFDELDAAHEFVAGLEWKPWERVQ